MIIPGTVQGRFDAFVTTENPRQVWHGRTYRSFSTLGRGLNLRRLEQYSCCYSDIVTRSPKLASGFSVGRKLMHIAANIRTEIVTLMHLLHGYPWSIRIHHTCIPYPYLQLVCVRLIHDLP